MSRSLLLRVAMAAGIALGPAAVSGHDFFLMPVELTSRTAGQLELQATVSSRFPQPENVVPADRIGQLYARGAGDPRLRISGPGSNALGLTLSTPRAGTVVAGVSALPRDVDYPEDRIGIILEEYNVGPEAVAAVERLTRPRTLQVSSRRFAKTIVCAVRCSDRAAAATPVGIELEFVGEGPNADHFRLLSGGRPLGNHPVDLVTSDGARRHLRTDAQGQVHLPADARGPLMLFAAVMHLPIDGQRFVLNLSSLTFSR